MGREYGRLCEATADELFGSDKAGLPVYTLPEADDLTRIAELVGLDSSEAGAAYCRVVRRTLYLDEQGQAPLRWHVEATKRQLKTPLETPPSLPLLVVFTLAAENMHADTGMAAHNFYGRVRPLLDVPLDREYRFVQEYQKHADLLWRSLNVWLEAWEGERGVPTAYSLGGYRHIGLPMSQAVVRQHDRIGLIETFEEEGLPPGLLMSPEDMEHALDAYASAEPSPLSRNIRRLWTNQDARSRIVQAAILELEAWAGVTHRADGFRGATSARIVAYLRTFLRTAVEFNISIPTGGEVANEVTFRSDQGNISLPIIVTSQGFVRLANMDAADPGSLLGEALSGWLDSDEVRKFTRRPRRVVPLRWHELQGCFIEVERAAFGEENLVLAMSDAAEKVKQLLGTCARPGWNEVDAVSGMPSGWVLFRQVQMVSVPDQASPLDVTPLVPRSRSTLSMRGGFDLPGRLRKWSSLQPPEVIGYSAGAETVAIRVLTGDQISEGVHQCSVESQGELAILTLADYEVHDGEYVASMFVDDEKKPRSSAVLRLRSADTPVHRVDDADMHLVYSPASGPLWPLSAGPANWPEYVNGARVLLNDKRGSQGSVAMRDFVPRRRRTRADISQSRVHVGVAYEPDSCMVTGRHRFELPPALGGRPQSRTVEGECTTCGLVKRFAATPWAAARKKRPTLGSRPIDLPPIASFDGLDQRVLFDAMCHVGQGSYRDLERIAGQIEGSGLYADTFLRMQEVLGHIDVRRDEYLQVSDWAVNAPTIAPVGSGGCVLVGAHSQAMLASLRKLFGADFVTDCNDRGALRVSIAVQVGALDSVVDEIGSLGIEVRASSPARDIAETLPALSAVEAGLKRISIPECRTLEKWDTESAAWTPTQSLSLVGAYRLKSFAPLYLVRSPRDIENETGGVGTAQLVKHIANAWAHDPLIGYHGKSGSVVVPLGADLPGLYGRALVLCSGFAPVEHLKSRMAQYQYVPRDVADVLYDRLTR